MPGQIEECGCQGLALQAAKRQRHVVVTSSSNAVVSSSSGKDTPPCPNTNYAEPFQITSFPQTSVLFWPASCFSPKARRDNPAALRSAPPVSKVAKEPPRVRAGGAGRLLVDDNQADTREMTWYHRFQDATICRCTGQAVEGPGAVKRLRFGRWKVLIT